jgi:hypothetical protein
VEGVNLFKVHCTHVCSYQGEISYCLKNQKFKKALKIWRVELTNQRSWAILDLSHKTEKQ